MKNPPKKILLSVVILWLLIGLSWGAYSGSFIGALLLLPLAAILGPYMALVFPFDLTFKIFYSLVLLISLAGIVVGWQKRTKIWGCALCVAGIMAWTFAGLIGLGTGA